MFLKEKGRKNKTTKLFLNCGEENIMLYILHILTKHGKNKNQQFLKELEHTENKKTGYSNYSLELYQK